MLFNKKNFLEINTNPINEKLKWALLLPICLLIFAIWLPFGFSLTGLIEEWGILQVFDDYGPIFFVNTSTSLAPHALRPLTVFPHAVAYSLDPDSFFYWHVLLIVSLLVKGGATTNLIWQATNSWRFAIIAGLLIIVYPADTMQLCMRSIHINWALSCVLLASTLFVAAFDSPKLIKAYSLTLISVILLWVSLAMYETSLMLILLPFFIIYIKKGLPTIAKQIFRAKGLVFLWILVIVLYLIYIGITIPKINSYQHSIMGDQNLFSRLQSNYPSLFSPGMTRSLLGGWVDAVQMIYKEIGYLGYIYLVVVISLIFGLIIYLLSHENKKATAPIQQLRVPIRLAVVSLLLIMLGYVPYLFSPIFIQMSQRTYLFASVGAVLFWVSVLMLLAKWQKMLAYVLAILLVTIGLGMQLFQFHHYQEISERQRTLLGSIVRNFDGNLNKKTLLLLDGSNQLTSTWMLLINYLKSALTDFYQKPIKAVEVCYMPGHEWRSIEGFPAGSCIEEEKKWIFRAPAALFGVGPVSAVPDKEILKKNMVVLLIKPDGSIESDSSFNDYRASLAQTSKRYQQILAPKKWPRYFKQFWTNNREQYRWSFGNWWSMEIPIRGSGWQEAMWAKQRFKYKASSLKTQENATLLFDLIPRKSTYSLQGQFGFFTSEEVRNSIKIYLNDHPISFQWLSLDKFSAEIPADVLSSGINKIMFYSMLDPKMKGLSLSLAWFELVPNAQLLKEKL